MLRTLLRAAVVALAAIACAPPAWADSYRDYLEVRCDEPTGTFAVRESGTWRFDGPFENGLIPIDRDEHGVMERTAPAQGDLMARCRLAGPEGAPLDFEVRRTRFLPASPRGMCTGSDAAEFAVLLNGIVLAEWEGGFRQCVSPQPGEAPNLARSVSFDSVRVDVCAPTTMEGDALFLRRVLTIRCRAEEVETVLRGRAWPPE